MVAPLHLELVNQLVNQITKLFISNNFDCGEFCFVINGYSIKCFKFTIVNFYTWRLIDINI